MTLIAQILNFVILVVILRAVAYKPVKKILAERSQRIQESLDKADADKAEAERTLRDYKAKLVEAREKAQSIVENAERVAAQDREAAVADTRREIEQMKKSAEEQMERERAHAVEQLKAEVVALSLAAAGKIIQKNLDEKDNDAIIGEFIAKLDAKKVGDASC